MPVFRLWPVWQIRSTTAETVGSNLARQYSTTSATRDITDNAIAVKKDSKLRYIRISSSWLIEKQKEIKLYTNKNLNQMPIKI
jgi:hypothetical protein